MVDILRHIPVRVVFDQFPQVITANANATIGEAFGLLAQYNIYALPVLDGSQCIGLVDYNDIFAKLANQLGDVNAENIQQVSSHIHQFAVGFLSENVRQFINFSQHNPYVTVNLDTDILTVVKEFSKHKETAKRLVVVDAQDHSRIVGVLSPSSIIRALSHYLDHPDILSVLHNKHVHDVATIGVTAVDEDITVYDSIRTMILKQTTSTAITSSGAFISVVSMKDFKVFSKAANWHSLFNDVGSYISDVRRNTPKAIFPVISTTLDATLERVLLRFAATKIHRMFVLNESRAAVGVISLRDVLRVFSAFPLKKPIKKRHQLQD